MPRKGLEPFLLLKMEMLGTLLGSGEAARARPVVAFETAAAATVQSAAIDHRNDGRVDGDGRGGGGRDDGGEAARPKEARAVPFALDGDVRHAAAHRFSFELRRRHKTAAAGTVIATVEAATVGATVAETSTRRGCGGRDCSSKAAHAKVARVVPVAGDGDASRIADDVGRACGGARVLGPRLPKNARRSPRLQTERGSK